MSETSKSTRVGSEHGLDHLQPRVVVKVLLTSFVLVAACDDEPTIPGPCWPGPDPDAVRGVIELGTGLDAFEPLLPDQALEVERGPQGGFHFIVRPRVRDIDGGTNGSTLTRFQAFRDGMEKIDIFQCPHNFEYDEVDASGFLVMSSVFLIIDDRLAATLDGSHVLLRTEVADERGRYAIDERWVFAALPQQPE